MYKPRTRPAPIDYDYIFYLAFTHPDNNRASIRKIARMLNLNSGTVFRSLKRQGLIKPWSDDNSENITATAAVALAKVDTTVSHETETPPSSHTSSRFSETLDSGPEPHDDPDHDCFGETKNQQKYQRETETETPQATSFVRLEANFACHRHPAIPKIYYNLII